jgi:hypothetical protein
VKGELLACSVFLSDNWIWFILNPELHIPRVVADRNPTFRIIAFPETEISNPIEDHNQVVYLSVIVGDLQRFVKNGEASKESGTEHRLSRWLLHRRL